MRVAMVSEHADPAAPLGGVDAGGQNVHVAALARALARAGHEVSVYTRRTGLGQPAWEELCPGAAVRRIDAGPPEPVPKDELLPFMPELAGGMVQAWGVRRPEVVHAHFWMSGVATRLATPPGVPRVQTFHALGTVKRRHQGAADTSPPERLATERMLALGSQRVVATCRDEATELAAMGVPAGTVRVVPCGVDLDEFRPTTTVAGRGGRSSAPAGPALSLLTVGRLVPRKGVDLVLRALALLPDARLTVVGGPDRAALAGDPEAVRLRRLAHDLGVGHRVDLVGAVPHEEMAVRYAAADVVVCAPVYEPFGIVPLEAMASGRPVVATAVGGLTDSVVDGLTGLLVPSGDARALAGALRALADPRRRRAMGRAGTRRARTLYGWDTVAARTAEVYEELLATRSRQGEDIDAQDVATGMAAPAAPLGERAASS